MKTLVIGASLNEKRYSNMAIKRLRNAGNNTVAIGIRSGYVEDVEIQTEKRQFENIHTITLYLNPLRQRKYYSYILNLKPKRVIFNPGTENQEFYELLKSAEIFFTEACTLVLLGTNQYQTKEGEESVER